MIRNILAATAVAAALVAAPAPARAETQTFNVDKTHSDVTFKVRHFVSNVVGRFNDFSGVIKMDDANPANSSVDFVIKATSIDTNQADRDKHLRTADFFDVEKFPEITFKSTAVKSTGKNQYSVTGNFTMHGVTKQITLPVTFLGSSGSKAGFETHTTIDRKDYGIVWNKALDAGGAILGDEVTVSVNIEADKPKPAAAAK